MREIVSGREKGVAGAQAGAQNAQAVVSLLLEPVQAATDVNHSLTTGVERAADVGGDCIVGTMSVGRHADIVIRHAQAQNRDAHQVKDAAQPGVGQRVGIPVRQQHQGATSASRKPAGIHQVIFRIGRAHRRRKSQELRVGSANFDFQFWIGHFARAEDLNFAALQAKVHRRNDRSRIRRSIAQCAGCTRAEISPHPHSEKPGRAQSRCGTANPAPTRRPIPWDAPRGCCPPRSAGFPSRTSIAGSGKASIASIAKGWR